MAAITITDATGTDSYELPDEIGTELTIGTAEDCSIPLPEVKGLSASHCRITRMEGGFILSDDQSTNGTYADARRIESEYLAPGITYTIGEATFVFETGAEPAAQPATDDAATKPLTADQQVTGAAPAKKKVVRRKPVARRTTLNAAELQQAAQKYKRDMARKRMTLIYIIIILLAAFYAGLALYSWQTTGNPLPVLLR